MNKNLTRIVVIGLIIAAIFGISWLQSRNNSEQANNNTPEQSEEEKKEDDKKTDSKDTKDNTDTPTSGEQNSGEEFTFTAQSGDSYTVMARKAVQSHSPDLSEAAVVYAETVLTNNAGSPDLNIGQSATIKKSDVEAVVQKAKNLSSAQVAAWSKYVSSVNFDTSGIGK